MQFQPWLFLKNGLFLSEALIIDPKGDRSKGIDFRP